MCDNLHLDSLKQCETPLNTLFFSEFNQNLLQRGIRQAFKNKTGIAIDRKTQMTCTVSCALCSSITLVTTTLV